MFFHFSIASFPERITGIDRNAETFHYRVKPEQQPEWNWQLWSLGLSSSQLDCTSGPGKHCTAVLSVFLISPPYFFTVATNLWNLSIFRHILDAFYHAQLCDLMGQTIPIGPTHDQFLESWKETLEICFHQNLTNPSILLWKNNGKLIWLTYIHSLQNQLIPPLVFNLPNLLTLWMLGLSCSTICANQLCQKISIEREIQNVEQGNNLICRLCKNDNYMRPVVIYGATIYMCCWLYYIWSIPSRNSACSVFLWL